MATIKQREVDCAISQSGWRSSQVISKMQKCQHSQTLLMSQIRNVQLMWQPGNTVYVRISRKTDIAKYARGPRLQGLLAENALLIQYFEQKMLVTC